MAEYPPLPSAVHEEGVLSFNPRSEIRNPQLIDGVCFRRMKKAA
jgi:hypothetical protein